MPESRRKPGGKESDFVTLGIAIAAIILFVGTGGSIMPQLVRAWTGHGAGPNLALTNAVLLNIALIIFGWRRYVDLQREVAERRSAEAHARHMAETDPLTGCLNRRSGAPAIDRLIGIAQKSGRQIAAMMIDLDNFKHVNDINGHQVGDQVLTTTAIRIRSILPSEAVILRIGGDEFFCAWVGECDAGERIAQFAESIIRAVASPIESMGACVEPTVSIGMTTCCLGKDVALLDSEALIHRADIALYNAKDQGRNRFCRFEPQMEDERRFRIELESELRRGIGRGEFIPYYEQQTNLDTGDVTGLEMLARWQSPRFGLLEPDAFLPVAEEVGLVGPLWECLIRQALADARDWDPRLILSTTISPVQLRDAWFARKLLHMLIEADFPPARLEIAITESCFHEDAAAIRAMVLSLRNLGIRISLNDFGSGYTNLAKLRALPFDRIKVDRSFVADLGRADGRESLIEPDVFIERSLSFPAGSDGGDRDGARDALRSLGLVEGRDFFCGKPENAEVTRRRLAGMDLLLRPAPAAMNADLAFPEAQRKAV